MRLSHLIVAAGFTASLASVAFADGLRVPVGDLSQRNAAIAFDHRLADAANQFCFERYRPMELDAIAACQKAIREEALDQLSPAQRDALDQSLRNDRALASAAR